MVCQWVDLNLSQRIYRVAKLVPERFNLNITFKRLATLATILSVPVQLGIQKYSMFVQNIHKAK